MNAGADATPPTPFPGFGGVGGDVDDLLGLLVRRRQELGLSQTAVAARMGTSQSAVARLEAGQTDTRLSTLERYATALGATVQYGVGPRDGAGT